MEEDKILDTVPTRDKEMKSPLKGDPSFLQLSDFDAGPKASKHLSSESRILKIHTKKEKQRTARKNRLALPRFKRLIIFIAKRTLQ